ncbi:hypothetical protein QFC24_004676 [Naganishia onofrii]|uniref:Uncharacterized protein n=1 Tax=Naganishia onofrii TaxID=1851511 RepID=A0ACC2XD45_9TREE|nr:hypothetical protein QFC24_004676 [Naganishia onofrii]
MSTYNQTTSASVSVQATAPAVPVSACASSTSVPATANAAVAFSTSFVSVPATANAAVISSVISSSPISATAPAAAFSTLGRQSRFGFPAVGNGRAPGKRAEVSILKSCVKKANDMSIPKKSVDWTLMHQYMIYEIAPEQRYDTGKYAIEAGEISWIDWRAQREWNYKNQDLIDHERRYIEYKMDKYADWDPDFDLDFEDQKEEAANMVEEHDTLHMIKVLEDFAKELEKEQAENALKSYDSGWDIILFGANPSLLEEEAPFSLSTDPNHPDNIFERNIDNMVIARDNYNRLVKELAELRKEVEARVNEEVMHQMAIEMDAEEERKENGLQPAESDWTVYLFGANPALEDEEMPFALTPCESDLSLAIFGDEAAAHVVEAPSRTVATLFKERNNEIEALGIPLSSSDKNIQMRISRNETPFLSASDEIFFEPGRLPFEYRLAVLEEDGEMSMLMDESLLMDESHFGLAPSDSSMSLKFASMDGLTFTDMNMIMDEGTPALLPSLASLDHF